MKEELLYLHVLNTADRRREISVERSLLLERGCYGRIKIYKSTG